MVLILYLLITKGRIKQSALSCYGGNYNFKDWFRWGMSLSMKEITIQRIAEVPTAAMLIHDISSKKRGNARAPKQTKVIQSKEWYNRLC